MRGTNEEDSGFGRVGDPHLGSGEGVVRSILALDGGGLHRERIRSGRSFRQTERTELLITSSVASSVTSGDMLT